MSEISTPSWSQFVKAHRTASGESIHDEAERIACAPFTWWITVPTNIVLNPTPTPRRDDIQGRRGDDAGGRRRIDPLGPAES